MNNDFYALAQQRLRLIRGLSLALAIAVAGLIGLGRYVAQQPPATQQVYAVVTPTATPNWTRPSQAFNAALYGKVLATGVQSLSEATLAKSNAYLVGKGLGIGWPRTNPFDVCTTADGCAQCVAFDQAAVCYFQGKNTYSIITPFASYEYVYLATGQLGYTPPPTVTGGVLISSPWPIDASPWPPMPGK